MPESLAEIRLAKLQYLRELQEEAESFDRGVAVYYNDPVGFARDCIKWPEGQFLTEYQQDVLTSLGKPEGGGAHRSRVAVRGPHGLGKTMMSSVAILWFALTREAAGVDWKVATTAGSWHQLTQYLWPEIHRWAGRIRWDVVRDGHPFTRNELQTRNLKLAHGHVFAGASANAALIEGAHADSLMFVYDESKAIPADTFDACEGAFSGTGEALALAISTPGDPAGRFFDIHARKPGYEDWQARHVTLEEAIAAGRISPGWAEQRGLQWGLDSALYANRVLGNFHSADEDSVIPLRWVELANERWQAWDAAGRPDPGRPHVIGVDVARSGSDSTVMAIRQGPVLIELRRSSKQDTMVTAGKVKGALDADPQATAIIDVIGVGGGVLDRLREQGARTQAFNAAAKSRRRDVTGEFGFVNTRAAAHWGLREQLDPSAGSEVCLPPDDMLLGDLVSPKWRVMSGGNIQVEPKDEVKKRIGRSPDDGDATVQAFWTSGGSWAEAYGGIECTGCGETYMAESAGMPVTACPSCGEPAPAREAPGAPREPGATESDAPKPHNPWAEVYGPRGAR